MIDPALPGSEEIDRNLRIVSELRNLCLSLSAAGEAAGLHRQGKRPPVEEPPRTGQTD